MALDHISVAVKDLEKAGRFYDVVFAPLGMVRLADRPETIGYGKKFPEFWINARPDMAPVPADTGVHIALRARSEELVLDVYQTALTNGGYDAGAPAPRQAVLGPYFGAFFKDPDGNKVEILTFPKPE
ncbi:VOC family protein [Sneathiella sp. CAU 1612]|uniref:VOC family protein n=1 Tax=Sneathiella sedimenti TaxID=2816034 RepID=A0ABS3F828_9PROT|nr:VOC family protein [Sneathiella sedimenti]MBO0334660.1 VOC family protein [Sneathiella sedimenti]